MVGVNGVEFSGVWEEEDGKFVSLWPCRVAGWEETEEFVEFADDENVFVVVRFTGAEY